jgi:hypothetical protein
MIVESRPVFLTWASVESDKGRKTGRDTSIAGNDEMGKRSAKKVLEKMMLRLPQSLAREFQRVYLELTALKFNESGKKLLLQDCHIEMVREWIERQTQLLNKQAGVLERKRLSLPRGSR